MQDSNQGLWPAVWLRGDALGTQRQAVAEIDQVLARLDESMRAFSRAWMLMERRVDSARRRRVDRLMAIRERRALRSAKHYRRRSAVAR